MLPIERIWVPAAVSNGRKQGAISDNLKERAGAGQPAKRIVRIGETDVIDLPNGCDKALLDPAIGTFNSPNL